MKGIRNPYLSHTKRALYHLSYIPTIFMLQNPERLVINNSENEKLSLLIR